LTLLGLRAASRTASQDLGLDRGRALPTRCRVQFA
jgi:hypothetical protein